MDVAELKGRKVLTLPLKLSNGSGGGLVAAWWGCGGGGVVELTNTM